MQTKQKGELFVISGPSGAGKGTLVDRLRSIFPNVWVSISATSRLPRKGDVEGETYFFLSKAEFENLIAQNGFIEYANVYGNYYGTPIKPIQEHLENGEIVILEIDVQGGFQVREQFPDANLIFIAPPSMSVLEKRLRGRATDSSEAIAKRLREAEQELKSSAKYDVVVVNDDLDNTTNELAEVIQSRLDQ